MVINATAICEVLSAGKGVDPCEDFFNKPNEFFFRLLFLLLFFLYQLALQFKVRSCFSNVYFAKNINIYNVVVFGNILTFYLSFPFKYKKPRSSFFCQRKTTFKCDIIGAFRNDKTNVSFSSLF